MAAHPRGVGTRRRSDGSTGGRLPTPRLTVQRDLGGRLRTGRLPLRAARRPRRGRRADRKLWRTSKTAGRRSSQATDQDVPVRGGKAVACPLRRWRRPRTFADLRPQGPRGAVPGRGGGRPATRHVRRPAAGQAHGGRLRRPVAGGPAAAALLTPHLRDLPTHSDRARAGVNFSSCPRTAPTTSAPPCSSARCSASWCGPCAARPGQQTTFGAPGRPSQCVNRRVG